MHFFQETQNRLIESGIDGFTLQKSLSMLSVTDLHRFLISFEVDKATGCWVWKKSCVKGYGRFKLKGVYKWVHRLSYELFRCPIIDGLQLDHLCRNKSCLRPDHLEPVTCAENIRRAAKFRYSFNRDRYKQTFQGALTSERTTARKKVCPKGHAYTLDNTYWEIRHSSNKTFGVQRCVICRKKEQVERRQRKTLTV